MYTTLAVILLTQKCLIFCLLSTTLFFAGILISHRCLFHQSDSSSTTKALNLTEKKNTILLGKTEIFDLFWQKAVPMEVATFQVLQIASMNSWVVTQLQPDFIICKFRPLCHTLGFRCTVNINRLRNKLELLFLHKCNTLILGRTCLKNVEVS